MKATKDSTACSAGCFFARMVVKVQSSNLFSVHQSELSNAFGHGQMAVGELLAKLSELSRAEAAGPAHG